MATQYHGSIGSGDVPDPHTRVLAPRDDSVAIVAEREAKHRPFVAPRMRNFTPCGHVPEADGAVGPSHGNLTAVRAEGNGVLPAVKRLLRSLGVVGEAAQVERLHVAPGPAILPLPTPPGRVAGVEQPVGGRHVVRQTFPVGEVDTVNIELPRQGFRMRRPDCPVGPMRCSSA